MPPYYHNKCSKLSDHDADSERFFRHMHTLSAQRGSDGKRLFVMPITLSSMDATWRVPTKSPCHGCNSKTTKANRCCGIAIIAAATIMATYTKVGMGRFTLFLRTQQ